MFWGWRYINCRYSPLPTPPPTLSDSGLNSLHEGDKQKPPHVILNVPAVMQSCCRLQHWRWGNSTRSLRHSDNAAPDTRALWKAGRLKFSKALLHLLFGTSFQTKQSHFSSPVAWISNTYACEQNVSTVNRILVSDTLQHGGYFNIHRLYILTTG
jgi:hypothetical protein